MAFSATTLHEISKEIKIRQGLVGSISLIEFDDEEYMLLRQYGRSIFKQELQNENARITFLAFCCEFIRRNAYLKEYKFWEDFHIELEVNAETYSSFIADDLLLKTYIDGGITSQQEQERLQKKNPRPIIDTLISAIPGTRQVVRKQFLQFFFWFQQNDIGPHVTQDTIERYKRKLSVVFPLPQKCLLRLNTDCRILADVIEYATKNSFSLTRATISSYRHLIIKELSGKYNTTRLLLFLRDDDFLDSLILKLQNHYTPDMFLQELAGYSNQNVQLPTGNHVSARKALSSWKNTTVTYGVYQIEKASYRVVPFYWLWLETIAEWPCEKVIKLKREGYRAYKKKSPFLIRSGKRESESKKCFLEDGTLFYIWTARITQGEPLFIDGHFCKESEGLDWKQSIELGFRNNEPIMVLVINWLKAFYPDKAGQQLTVRTSQEDVWTKRLSFEPKGSCQLHKAISFPILMFERSITTSIHIANQEFARKTIYPETVYLFASSTGEYVPINTRRKWGDHTYYLFTTLEIEPSGENVDVERLFTEDDYYAVYRVERSDPNIQEFTLYIGNAFWSFEQEQYFYFYHKHKGLFAESTDIRLATNQIQLFDQQIQIRTNIHLGENLICRVFWYEELLLEEAVFFEQSNTDLYFFKKAFIEKLNNIVVHQHHYGQCDVCLYQDERQLAHLSVSIIPNITFSLYEADEVLYEGERGYLEVLSSHLEVWNPLQKQLDNTAYIPFYPSLVLNSQNIHAQNYNGLIYLTPETITVPVIFPKISATIDIAIKPVVFGRRLYQKYQNKYEAVEEFNYYEMNISALYIFTQANSRVVLKMYEKAVWSGNADRNGDILIQNLAFLQEYCETEQTEITIVNEGRESTFFVRWIPRIYTMNVKENRAILCINGPIGTGIALHLIDIKDQVKKQEQIKCKGKYTQESVVLPIIEPTWGYCYLVPIYCLSNDVRIPSSYQQRLEPSFKIIVPFDWLLLGVGISDKETFDNYLVE